MNGAPSTKSLVLRGFFVFKSFKKLKGGAPMKLARNSVAEKSGLESEGGQKFLFPDPFPFCPPERKIKNSFQKKFELPYKNSSKIRKTINGKTGQPKRSVNWNRRAAESKDPERSRRNEANAAGFDPGRIQRCPGRDSPYPLQPSPHKIILM